jgi:predicted transposase/invertase (TIGR01784 family)
MSEDKTDHDGAYKKLFSNEHMVEALVTHFFSDALGSELDFSAMTSIDPGFVTRALTRRTSDLIWKIPRDDGDDVFVILILEFQSTPDASMAMRMLNYTSLLYDHLVGSEGLKDDKKLPPVLPFVIYNGASTWNAATRTEALIDVEESSNL